MLTNNKLKNLKFNENGQNNHSDRGDGLYVAVLKTGSRVFRYDFRFDGKQQRLTYGKYPDISLKNARVLHEEARALIAAGIHPNEHKKQKIIEQNLKKKKFSDYAAEWMEKGDYKESTLSDMKLRIAKNLSPYLDKKSVHEWTTRELLDVLMIIVDRGAIETARRMASVMADIYDDIFSLGDIEENPAARLTKLLPRVKKSSKQQFSHITDEKDLAVFLRILFEPWPREDCMTFLAIKLLPYLFLRPGNVRNLRWEQIDFGRKRINIDASEMKNNRDFVVPLSKQAIQILKQAREVNGNQAYVFSTSWGRGAPMSENTMTKAIQKRINPDTGKAFGKDFITSHGFRHTATTALNEMHYNKDWIEAQMSHLDSNQIRQTYNKAQYLTGRIEMMQEWADYLDSLRLGKPHKYSNLFQK